MRGRDIFNVTYPLMYAFSLLLRLLPRAFIQNAWSSIDLIPGIFGVGVRYCFVLRLSKKVGRNVFFGRGVEVIGWKKLEIGSNVSIHKDCYIDASGGLKIGNDVSIAHASSIITFEHTWLDPDVPIRSNPCEFSPVEIKNDVWIGCGTRLLAGITVESRSIVAAGAVVTSDVPRGALVGGVPAKKIKDLIR